MPAESFNPLHVDEDVPQYTPGTKLDDDDGFTWLYLRAGTSIDIYDAVRLDSDYDVPTLDTNNSSALGGTRVGVAQTVIPLHQWGWVLVYGLGRVNAKANTDAYAQLHTSTTGGHVTDATAGKSIREISLTADHGSGDGSAPCQLNWPSLAF